MEDFNIQKFLIENKMTRNSRLLSENDFDTKHDVLSKTLVDLPLEDFTKVIKAAGDYDIWMDGAKQMRTNLDDKVFRAETISTFEDDDIDRYNQVLQTIIN